MMERVDDGIVIEVDDVQFDEYTEGIAFATVRVKHARWWMLAIGAAFGLAFNYAAPHVLTRPAVWVVLFFGAYAFVGWLSWSSRSAMYDRFRANARSTYRFSTAGILEQCALCKHEYTWGAVARYRKTAHTFSVILKSCSVIILPRRLVTDEAAFEELLAAHIT